MFIAVGLGDLPVFCGLFEVGVDLGWGFDNLEGNLLGI